MNIYFLNIKFLSKVQMQCATKELINQVDRADYFNRWLNLHDSLSFNPAFVLQSIKKSSVFEMNIYCKSYILLGCDGVSIVQSLPQKVSCHVGESCTEISCCTDTEMIARSLETKLIIAPCDFKLTVGIDRLSFDVDLFDFEWGR